MNERAPRLCRELLAQPLRIGAVQERLVVLGERPQEGFFVAVHRNDAGRQSLRDRGNHPVGVGPAAVGLVDEEKRRHAQAVERAPEERRLCLHPFDRRDDENGAVEHSEHALDLGDEVRVPRRVDEIDGDVVDRERRYRGLDRDAALLLERERVGLRGAVVDAPELVDHAGGMQQPLGERCLTGVYMRQDSQVERTSKQAANLPIRSNRP